MTMEQHTSLTAPIGPKGPDWAQLTLEETWPDKLNLTQWSGWRALLRTFMSRKRCRVQLPDNLPGRALIPKYALQEFHNLPNGNYSRRFSRGYITGFDFMMRGTMSTARAWIAHRLQHCLFVADVGTAGGRTAAAVKNAGVPYVWGIDPSPYLLQHAAADFPEIEFIPGIAEQLPFNDHQLDGLSLCFVLHEIPPRYVEQAMREFFRVLRPGGRLAIVEPSAAQMHLPRWRFLMHHHGWRHLYFAMLAKLAHEPFVHAWHAADKTILFKESGFNLLEEHAGMPFHCWLAEKAQF